VESSGLGNWRRTRRNVLAAGGLLAGAVLSQLGASKANAGNGKGNNGNGKGNGGGGGACFLRGTRLLTPSGERKVEELRIGDLVTTLSGEAKPITWIGRRVYRRATDSRYPKSVLPVRVARGALGPDAPHCNLFISQHHALRVDGLFIKAIDLVNGSLITLHLAVEPSEIEYLHVKLAQHDVIFAEGAPSDLSERKPAPASFTASKTFNRLRVERASHEAARVLRRRAMAPGRPRTFMIRPVVS
jgi:hypothetical protein